MSQSVTMFVANVSPTNDFLSVAANTATNAQVAIRILCSVNARLVGDARSPCSIVMPKGVFGDVTDLLVFVVFYISIEEILPRIVILRFVFNGECSVKATLIECANTWKSDYYCFEQRPTRNQPLGRLLPITTLFYLLLSCSFALIFVQQCLAEGVGTQHILIFYAKADSASANLPFAQFNGEYLVVREGHLLHDKHIAIAVFE